MVLHSKTSDARAVGLGSEILGTERRCQPLLPSLHVAQRTGTPLLQGAPSLVSVSNLHRAAVAALIAYIGFRHHQHFLCNLLWLWWWLWSVANLAVAVVACGRGIRLDNPYHYLREDPWHYW